MLFDITDLRLTQLKYLCAANTCETCPIGCKNKEIATVQVLDGVYDSGEIKYPIRIGDIIDSAPSKCEHNVGQCETCEFGINLCDGLCACMYDIPMIVTKEREEKFREAVAFISWDTIDELNLTDKVVGRDAKAWVYKRPSGEEEESDSSLCEAHVNQEIPG